MRHLFLVYAKELHGLWQQEGSGTLEGGEDSSYLPKIQARRPDEEVGGEGGGEARGLRNLWFLHCVGVFARYLKRCQENCTTKSTPKLKSKFQKQKFSNA